MRHTLRWKRVDHDPQTEVLRDIRALLYILALDITNHRAHNRLTALQKERMEEIEIPDGQ
jgi:hypothetical protein